MRTSSKWIIWDLRVVPFFYFDLFTRAYRRANSFHVAGQRTLTRRLKTSVKSAPSLSDPSFWTSDRVQLVILSDSSLFSSSIHINGRSYHVSSMQLRYFDAVTHTMHFVCMRISISAFHCQPGFR